MKDREAADGLLETPLAAAHKALGARMVPFCGWLMPLQYQSILAEHLHTRASAGLFDLSHMGRLSVKGPDAGRLLQHVTTNDVEHLAEGQAQYSLLCNEEGGIIEDFLVFRFAWGWWLVVNAANRQRVVGHLDRLRESLGCDASIGDETFRVALLGLQGPRSEEVLQPLVADDLSTLGYYHGRETQMRSDQGAALPAIVSRTGYTGEDGFEIAIEGAHVTALWERLLSDSRVLPVGLGARDTLRLEAGMALYGHELSEEITPYEAGLGRVVKLSKSAFHGREALLALSNVPPRRRLVGLLPGPGPIPRAECDVLKDGERVGVVASGTFSPTLKRPIATAYVRSEALASETELAVAVRESAVPARVVSLPFVPHRTKRRPG